MESIRRFCALSIYHRILTMFEEGKQVPQDILLNILELKSLE
jgi:hypothetical protein